MFLRIDEPSKVGEARRLVAELSRQAELTDDRTGAAAVIANEAATNLIKHAKNGELHLRVVDGAVELLAVDHGPGMSDPDSCLRDGYSSAGTSGTGLGAIKRLASEFDIYSQTGKGTVIVARIANGANGSDLVQGAVEVPARGETVCGDAWIIVPSGRAITMMVADGLGHGIQASNASQEARRVVEANPDLPPGALIERIHLALRSSRGAAVSVAQLETEVGEVRFAGVGNITGVVVGSRTAQQMVSHNGTAGHEVRRIQEFRYPWTAGALLVMHSDGLSARWNLDQYPLLRLHDPALIAGALYRDFTRGRDDATVVVLKADK